MKELYVNPLARVIELECKRSIAQDSMTDLPQSARATNQAMEEGASGFGNDFWN